MKTAASSSSSRQEGSGQSFVELPETSRIRVRKEMDAKSEALKNFCYVRPVAVMEGLPQVLGIDLKLFSTYSLCSDGLVDMALNNLFYQQKENRTRGKKNGVTYSRVGCRLTTSHTVKWLAAKQVDSWEACKKLTPETGGEASQRR